jgi:hypothetical protein
MGVSDAAVAPAHLAVIWPVRLSPDRLHYVRPPTRPLVKEGERTYAHHWPPVGLEVAAGGRNVPDGILPPQMVALLHHVELTRDGWWEKGLQHAILAYVWLKSEPLGESAITDGLRGDFGIEVSKDQVGSGLRQLGDAGELTQPAKGLWRLSETRLRELELQLAEAEEDETAAEAHFARLLAAHCPALDPEATWARFNTEVLVPLVSEAGVGVYELLTGTGAPHEHRPVQDFLKAHPAECSDALGRVVAAFWDARLSRVRSYVLRHLTAYFFVAAGNLTQDTVDYLTALPRCRPTFVCFLDTNFLLALLGLDDDASNEAASLLRDVIGQLGGRAKVKLAVLPITIDETRKRLVAAVEELEGFELRRNVAKGAADAGLSGLRAGFASKASGTSVPLRAENYFRPFIDDMVAAIRSSGADIHKVDMGAYSLDQRVIDDTQAAIDYEATVGSVKTKRREAWAHDVKLWHFASDKRAPVVDAPLDATYWVVTLDYKFIGFDRYRTKLAKGRVPMCIRPSTLIQALQFWTPRTDKMDEAMLGSMRLPLLFHRFDDEAERAAIGIVRALSRFRDIDDLPAETVTEMLLNQGLRHKIAAEPDTERQADMVRDALIARNQATIHDYRCQLSQRDSQIGETRDLLARAVDSREATEAHLRAAASELAEIKGKMSEMGDEIRAEREARTQATVELARRETASARRQFVVLRFAVPLLISVGVALLLRYAAGRWTTLSTSSVLLVSLGLCMVAWTVQLVAAGRRNDAVTTWKPFALLLKFHRWLWGYFAVQVVVGIAKDYVLALWRELCSR